MKQTAVEWYGLQIGILISKFFNNEISKSEVHFKRIEIEEQAKEMEKDQQGYSEEEVELIANEMVNWAIDNVGNPNPRSGKKFDEVIIKFKNK